MFIIQYPTLVSRLVIHYADWLDVDEDVPTICTHNGSWEHDTMAGITCRSVCDTPTLTSGAVALKNKC